MKLAVNVDSIFFKFKIETSLQFECRRRAVRRAEEEHQETRIEIHQSIRQRWQVVLTETSKKIAKKKDSKKRKRRKVRRLKAKAIRFYEWMVAV